MINIIAIGDLKSKDLINLCNDYIKKISNYHKIQIHEIKHNLKCEEDKIIDKEADMILNKLDKKSYVVLVDLHGKSLDSIGFSKILDTSFNNYSSISFIIGGSYGLSDKLRDVSDIKIKLSDLTFLHTHTRFILLEQIYRAFKIIKNETYHK